MAYLVKVKPDEQDVESPYPDTLRAIMDCFNRLAEYEDANLSSEQVKALCTRLDAARELVKRSREALCVGIANGVLIRENLSRQFPDDALEIMNDSATALAKWLESEGSK